MLPQGLPLRLPFGDEPITQKLWIGRWQFWWGGTITRSTTTAATLLATKKFAS